MKSFLVLALFVAISVARPIEDDEEDPKNHKDFVVPNIDNKDAVVIKFDNNNIGIGEYKYEYQTNLGTGAIEERRITNPGTENEAFEVRGQYVYIGPDNVVYSVTYKAGPNGFEPTGKHIPKI